MTKSDNPERRFDINRSISKGPVKFDVVSRFIRLPDDREVRLSRARALVLSAIEPCVHISEKKLTERVNHRANLFHNLRQVDQQKGGPTTQVSSLTGIEFFTPNHTSATLYELRRILGPTISKEVIPKRVKTAKK